MKQAYWAVNCRSCGMPLRIGLIEDYDPDKTVVPGDLEGTFGGFCVICEKKDTYKRKELYPLIQEQS